MDYDGDCDDDFTNYSDGMWHFSNDDGWCNKSIWTGGVVNDIPPSRRQLLRTTP